MLLEFYLIYVESDPVPSVAYKKTVLIGGGGGDDFDDFLADTEKPLKITNMVINYGSSINGIKVIYLLYTK